MHASPPYDKLLACPDCDLLLQDIGLPDKANAVCPRCEHTLREHHPDSVLNALVLSITGLILFVPAVSFPLLSMSVLGLRGEASLIDSIIALSTPQFWSVAVVVTWATVIAPFFNLWLMFTISITLYTHQKTTGLRQLLRLNHLAREWAMTEVFFLGVLVAIVKLQDLAKLLPGTGLLCFLGLMIICILLNAFVDEHELWESLENEK